MFFFCINRAQSVRRTSLRDKTLTTKKDAVEETRLRLRAQEVNLQVSFAVIKPLETTKIKGDMQYIPDIAPADDNCFCVFVSFPLFLILSLLPNAPNSIAELDRQ